MDDQDQEADVDPNQDQEVDTGGNCFSSDEKSDYLGSDGIDVSDDELPDPLTAAWTDDMLYDGAGISVGATYCAIMEFSISSCLTYSAIDKLL